jgi:thiamine-monophosphate kinase
MAWGEFEIIRRCFTRPCADPDVLLGIGDDAAVVDVDGPLVVTTDTLVAGVHFPDGMPADALGHRALAVNLSDLAAMGAEPRWATLALTLAEADERWLEAFSTGFFALAERQRVTLIGGDLTRGPLTATVQLLGTVERERLLTRGGASVDDDVYVTGTLGDAAAGLALLKQGGEADENDRAALQERFLRPAPRLAEGRALAPLASAAIDISDGLLADLGHVCEASRCGALIDVERLPLSSPLLALFPPGAAREHALTGGDDYELCFTAPPARREAIDAALRSLGPAPSRIGRIVAGRGVVVRRDGEPFTPAEHGYRHF